MKDDIARVPTVEPELGNVSKYWQEHSWETRDELFQLSDTIGSNDIIGLRPIYRKDLPKDYIAYWEVKINGKKGEKYLIISAGIIQLSLFICVFFIHPFIDPSLSYCYSSNQLILPTKFIPPLLSTEHFNLLDF